MHHYIAEVVSRLQQKSDWNANQQTHGCITGPWQR